MKDFRKVLPKLNPICDELNKIARMPGSKLLTFEKAAELAGETGRSTMASDEIRHSNARVSWFLTLISRWGLSQETDGENDNLETKGDDEVSEHDLFWEYEYSGYRGNIQDLDGPLAIVFLDERDPKCKEILDASPIILATLSEGGIFEFDGIRELRRQLRDWLSRASEIAQNMAFPKGVPIDTGRPPKGGARFIS